MAKIKSKELILVLAVLGEKKEGSGKMTENALERRKSVKSFAHVALFSAGLHILLVILKYWLGILSGSIALKADAFHSLADVLCSLTVYAGIKISERTSKNFPYGLYKVENIASLLTSFAILFAAYEIIKEVIYSDSTRIISNIPITVTGLSVIAILIFLFSRYELKVGRKIGSPSLVADAKHISADLFSTGGILIGIFVSSLWWNIDRYIAVIIALIMVRLGWTILIDSLKVLLDASISREVLGQISKVISSFPQVMEIKQLSGRHSGRYKFIEAEVFLDVETLREAHELSSHIEEEVYDCFPEVDKILIHYEPEPLKPERD